MSDTCRIGLTYRGPVGHRGINISRESYGRIWTLCLADGLWTLTDHHGEALNIFTQKELHKHVALPGSMAGYPDLYLLGLGSKIQCFQPDPEVVDVLRTYLITKPCPRRGQRGRIRPPR